MKTKVVRCLRFMFVVALFVVSIATLPSTSRLLAQDQKSGNEFDYYSDDTFTCQVGYAIYCSNGQWFRSGDETPYVIVSPSGC